jgi:hypothetical protein
MKTGKYQSALLYSLMRRAEALAWMGRGALVIMVSLTSLCGAVADEFRATKIFLYPGEGSEIKPSDPSICRLWGQNLNYFARKNRALSCARPIAPKLSTQLSRPDWKILKPRDSIDLIRRLDAILFLDRRSQSQPVDEKLWREGLDKTIAAGDIDLRIADIDLVGSDHPERVIRYFSNECRPVRGGAPLGERLGEYFVSNERMTVIMRLSVAQGAADLLLYRGKLYAELVDEFGNAWVFEFFDGGPQTEECQQRFLPETCADQRPEWSFVQGCKYEFHRND